MDPYGILLRDEVIYLHTPSHHQKKPTLNPSTLLQIPKPHPTKFKKQKKKRPKLKKVKKIPPQPDPLQASITECEWPCPSFPDPPPSAFEWPVLKLNPAPVTRLPTAEEQARYAATQVQQKALKSAQEFFVDSESDDDCGGGGSDDEDDFMDEEDGCEEYKFFWKAFDEDGELRRYYEENFERGEFFCLVCGGIGKKVGKRFKGCKALVQHSNGIAKTKKRRAHRAFAQVVCKVIGWDIDRLPGLSSKSDECQGSAEVGMEGMNMLNENPVMENDTNAEMVMKVVSNVDQGEELRISTVPSMSIGVGHNVIFVKGSAEVGVEGINRLNENPVMEKGTIAEMVLKVVSNVDQREELRISTVPAVAIGVGHDMMFIESHLKADDADTCMENLDSGYLSTVDGKIEVVVNCLKSLKVGDANTRMENHDCGFEYGGWEDRGTG